MVSSLDPLRRKAETGDLRAQISLASALYGEDQADEALSWLGRAAKGGSLEAMTELGARLVVGAGAPRSPADGVNLLLFSAGAGDGLAARYLAILYGTGHGVARSWADALDWLQKAAEAGEPGAARELALLARCGDEAVEEAETVGSDRWSRLRAMVDPEAWLTPPALRLLSHSPRIGVIEGFAPAPLCAWLISAAEDRLRDAGVTDKRTGRFMRDPARTNKFTQVRLFDFPLPLVFLREQIASLVGQPSGHFEIMNILSYEAGEQYEPHHDFMDPAQPGFRQELATLGQRAATFLVYLNEDYDGGETAFLDLGISFRGKAGDALFFMNVSPEGTIDARTRHAGLPPARGRKWLLSQWVRDRAQAPA